MTLCRLKWAVILPLLAVLGQPVLASSRQPLACTRALAPIQPETLISLRERNTSHLLEVERQHPLPAFNDLDEEIKKEQVGEIGPRALQQLLGKDQSFVSTPAPSAPMDTAVNLHMEAKSFPVHVDQEWHGHRTSTAVYASLPKSVKPRGDTYLVGAEYPVVVISLHGGGTPTATGKNGMSIGEALAPQGIPVLAPDMPGHGQATRQLDGFLTFKDQVDWLMKITEKLIDPRVKIVLTGHSWGGEFAVYMHRLSADPKYARIVRYIALSPPVEVSPEWEAWYQTHFTEFKDKIAPSDYEFQENTLVNGKISEIGSYFTKFTSLNYKTPPLTAEEQKALKPLTVIVGQNDGLVYVGREKIYDNAFENLTGQSQYILLGPGNTWKSKKPEDKFVTGHNVFDRYIDGTTTPEVYKRLADLVLAEAPQGFGAETNDAAVARVDEVFRSYANFFLFRQFIREHEEYVLTPTATQAGQTQKKLDLDSYLAKVDDLNTTYRSDAPKQVQKALEQLRVGLGITEPLNLIRAQKELAVPDITPERSKELADYMAKAEAAEENFKKTFQDPAYDQDIAALTKEFGPTLEKLGLNNVADYKPVLDKYNAIKKPTNEENKTRSALARLHQRYAEVMKKHRVRFDTTRDKMLDALPRPAGVEDFGSAKREFETDRSPERRAKLAAYIEQWPKVEAATKEQGERDLEKSIAALGMPEGVESIESARAAKIEQDTLFNFTYAPAGDPELTALAGDIAKLTKECDDLRTELQKSEAAMTEGAGDRTAKLRSWDGFGKMMNKGVLSSARLRDFQQQLQNKYDTYAGLYFEYEPEKGKWLEGLAAAGQLTVENILRPPQELAEKHKALLAAKHDYETTRAGLDDLRRDEAVKGALEGPAGPVQEAQKVAMSLWGKQDAPGVIQKMRDQEQALEILRRNESTKTQELERAQMNYAHLMIERGHQLPFTITRVNLREALDLSYNDLVERLREDPVLAEAFRATMEKWTAYLSLLRVESQSKDTGNY